MGEGGVRVAGVRHPHSLMEDFAMSDSKPAAPPLAVVVAPAKPIMPAAPTPSPARRYPYVEDPNVPGKRLFDTAAVQRQLDASIATLRPNSTYAFIAHGDSDGNFTLSAVVKRGEHWSFAGIVDHSKEVKWRAGAEVRFEG